MTTRKIAEKAGCTQQTVWKERKRLLQGGPSPEAVDFDLASKLIPKLRSLEIDNARELLARELARARSGEMGTIEPEVLPEPKPAVREPPPKPAPPIPLPPQYADIQKRANGFSLFDGIAVPPPRRNKPWRRIDLP